MKSPLKWSEDGGDWPHREASTFVHAGGLNWHVQRMGEGPPLLLLHGTGASTHSWRTILPLLAKDYSVIAPDLPGHAFTAGGSWQGRSLDGMGRALDALLEVLEVEPAAIVGHSAGVAIALHMGGKADKPIPVIGYNPALMPFEGLGEQLFPAMAKLLLLNPLAPRLFAGIARIPGEAERFLKRATNSQIDAEGLACYSKLVGNSRHCQGALPRMARPSGAHRVAIWSCETGSLFPVNANRSGCANPASRSTWPCPRSARAGYRPSGRAARCCRRSDAWLRGSRSRH